MKKLNVIALTIFLALFVIFSAEVASDNGKAGYTGSTGESKCNNCHNSYTLNTGGGSITMASPNMTNWQYIPGQAYTINLTVARSANALFGMGLEALTSANLNAGTFAMTTSSTQIKTKTISGVVRNNVVHTLNGGASSGAKTFTFNWTAPATSVGNITFYFTGVAANGDGNETSDYVYSGSQVITPVTTGIEPFSFAGSVSVFPNPCKDQLNLSFDLEKTEFINASLFTPEGKLVSSLLNHSVRSGLSTTSFSLKEKSIQSGLYFLKIEGSDKNSITKKIIVE
jgi:hypothetical protein